MMRRGAALRESALLGKRNLRKIRITLHSVHLKVLLFKSSSDISAPELLLTQFQSQHFKLFILSEQLSSTRKCPFILHWLYTKMCVCVYIFMKQLKYIGTSQTKNITKYNHIWLFVSAIIDLFNLDGIPSRQTYHWYPSWPFHHSGLCFWAVL